MPRPGRDAGEPSREETYRLVASLLTLVGLIHRREGD